MTKLFDKPIKELIELIELTKQLNDLFNKQLNEIKNKQLNEKCDICDSIHKEWNEPMNYQLCHLCGNRHYESQSECYRSMYWY